MKMRIEDWEMGIDSFVRVFSVELLILTLVSVGKPTAHQPKADMRSELRSNF